VETKTEVVSEQNLLVSSMGVTPTNTDTATHNMLTSVESAIATKPNLELLWNLESLGITELPSTCDDDLALDHLNKTVKLVDGRYKVTWPWKEENPNLPSDYYLKAEVNSPKAKEAPPTITTVRSHNKRAITKRDN